MFRRIPKDRTARDEREAAAGSGGTAVAKGGARTAALTPPDAARYSFTASAKYCSYTSSASLALVTTSSTGASG